MYIYVYVAVWPNLHKCQRDHSLTRGCQAVRQPQGLRNKECRVSWCSFPISISHFVHFVLCRARRTMSTSSTWASRWLDPLYLLPNTRASRCVCFCVCVCVCLCECMDVSVCICVLLMHVRAYIGRCEGCTNPCHLAMNT